LTGNINNLEDNGNNDDLNSAVDEREIKEVTEIVRLLSKTISTIKIFLADHTTVKNQIADLWTKLDAFLEKNQTLEIDIQEYSFTYKNKPVFQDYKMIKSLPFLLYKDGMQTLSFYKGLKKEELQGFMEIIKNVYELPPEESDIINLLWEKDFANIRYFAPDEFLETKIGIGKEPADILVDRDALFSGSIELLPEDQTELQSAKEEPDILEQTVSEEEGLWEDTEFMDQTPTLTEQENRILEAMLMANRQVNPEAELVLLITEMLNLVEDSERFKAILDAITHVHKDLVQKGDFTRAYQLLSHAMEIKNIASYESEDKEPIVHGFLNKLKTKEIVELIKKPLLEDKVTDFSLLFPYLDLLLGTDALSLLAELYEKKNNEEFRKGSLDYFKEKATKNPEILTKIVDDNRTKLTREVIAILSTIPEKRAIQGFAVFIQSKNKTIKTDAIKKLGTFKDVTSNKILLGFLNDTDENIRILAACHIPGIKDDFIVEQVVRIATDRNFKNKSKQEKQAILDILGRSKTEKAYEDLEKILTKLTFFSGSKNVETGFCAIQTLKERNSPESRRILKKAMQSKNRKIKKESRLASKNLSKPQDQEK
jgi:HEAT repeat protein